MSPPEGRHPDKQECIPVGCVPPACWQSAVGDVCQWGRVSVQDWGGGVGHPPGPEADIPPVDRQWTDLWKHNLCKLRLPLDMFDLLSCLSRWSTGDELQMNHLNVYINYRILFYRSEQDVRDEINLKIMDSVPVADPGLPRQGPPIPTVGGRDQSTIVAYCSWKLHGNSKIGCANAGVTCCENPLSILGSVHRMSWPMNQSFLHNSDLGGEGRPRSDV